MDKQYELELGEEVKGEVGIAYLVGYNEVEMFYLKKVDHYIIRYRLKTDGITSRYRRMRISGKELEEVTNIKRHPSREKVEKFIKSEEGLKYLTEKYRESTED